MTDAEFLTKVETRSITRAEWTHDAHVRMAWLYAARSDSYRAARGKVRRGAGPGSRGGRVGAWV